MKHRIPLVALLVPDYDEALDFYCRALKFDLVADQPLEDGKRWVVIRPLGSDAAGLLLARADDEIQSAAIGNQTGGRVGFFLETDDFQTTRNEFERAGVIFEEATRHEPYGKVAVFRDPYGNRWDLIELA